MPTYKEWHTHYPGAQDVPATDQPDVVNDTVPGAGDGDFSRASQLNTLKAKVHDLALKVGDDTKLPAGSLLERTVRNSADDTTPGYVEDKLSVSAGLTLSTAAPGGNEVRNIAIAWGTSAGTACQGNDSRIGTDSNAVHKATAGELNAMTVKGTPIGADLIMIEDSADTWSKKKVAISTLPAGTDSNAIHKATASEIHGLTLKATPIGADEIVIEDSADSWNKKRATISTLPAGVDSTAIHKATAGEINAMTVKAVPVGTDLLVIEDSDGSGWAKKKIAISTLPSSGAGFNGYENEFTAAGGDETFTLAQTPAVNANMLSGRSILGVFRNGQRLRYQAAPATGLEYGYTATTSINCKSLTAGDIVTVVYST